MKTFSIVLFCLLFAGTSLSAKEVGTLLPDQLSESGGPQTTGLNCQYGIYFSSEDGMDLFSQYGSYMRFQMKVGIGATYDYYIKEGQRVTGRVESYNETEHGIQYVLENFFNGKHNAIMKICDLPDCDNLKAAFVYYADNKQDPTGATIFELVLNTDDFAPTPSLNVEGAGYIEPRPQSVPDSSYY